MKKTESELRELREKRASNNGGDCAFAYYDSNNSMDTFGLSKREYFAGLALQAVISTGNYSELEIGICSVNFADALLEALEM